MEVKIHQYKNVWRPLSSVSLEKVVCDYLFSVREANKVVRVFLVGGTKFNPVESDC